MCYIPIATYQTFVRLPKSARYWHGRPLSEIWRKRPPFLRGYAYDYFNDYKF